jgi:hypothetical protein
MMLDDKLLSNTIKNIAKVLCAVHHVYAEKIEFNIICGVKKNIPLPYYRYKLEPIADYRDWAMKCKANYLYLSQLGLVCFMETVYRNINNRRIRKDKYGSALIWARDNVPDLPDQTSEPTRLPLFMPRKYWLFENNIKNPSKVDISRIETHRNFYKEKLRRIIAYRNDPHENRIFKESTWTNRTRPEWLKEI